MSIFNIENQNLINQALSIILCLSFIVQAGYWIGIHARMLYWKPRSSGIRYFPVSVVICAKNEEANLRSNLPLILEQDFPEFEVLVVNDASTDGTEDVLRDLKDRYPHLKTTAIRENVHIHQGKKLALTVGIKGAMHEWVVLTDADCRPAGRKWLRTLQRNFRKDRQIVLGIGKYLRKRGLLNLLIRYDNLFTAIQYTGFALAGFPYMGVGRNLAYRKSLFFENKGFASHYELASGDDDLFVNQAATRHNTCVEIRPESHTYSTPSASWKNWYIQKRRHLTTGPRYRAVTKILLGGELASRMLFYLSLIILASRGIWILAGGLLTARLIISGLVIKLGMLRLDEKYLLLPSLLLDFSLPWLHAFMVFSNYVASKRARWK